jgi:hypothetical protein
MRGHPKKAKADRLLQLLAAAATIAGCRCYHNRCNIPGFETRNSEENDMCIAFKHQKIREIFAQLC